MELRLKTDDEQMESIQMDNGWEANPQQEMFREKKPTMYNGQRALENMEGLRKTALRARSMHIGAWVLEISDYIVCAIAAINGKVELAGLCIVGFLVFRIVKRLASENDDKAYKRYVGMYTDEFVPVIVRTLFDRAYYCYEMGFSESEVRQMQIIRMGNQFRSEDLLRATYNDVNFKCSDVIIEDLDDSRGYLGDQYVSTLFSGIIYEFDFNKKFVCNMQIQDKNFIAPALPSDGVGMRRVQLENVTFNKKFKTFTTNEHDTFYILTPQLMEQILALSNKYLSLSMNFVNQKLVIAVNTPKGTFEPSKLTGKMIYEDEKEKIRREIMDIIEIVERLKLDNKIFLS